MTLDENMIYAVKILPNFGEVKDETIYLAKPVTYNGGSSHKWDILGRSYGYTDRLFPAKLIEPIAVGRIKDFLRSVGASHVQPI
jgi:hypothetical protein